jgi:hypothetical protein
MKGGQNHIEWIATRAEVGKNLAAKEWNCSELRNHLEI